MGQLRWMGVKGLQQALLQCAACTGCSPQHSLRQGCRLQARKDLTATAPLLVDDHTAQASAGRSAIVSGPAGLSPPEAATPRGAVGHGAGWPPAREAVRGHRRAKSGRHVSGAACATRPCSQVRPCPGASRAIGQAIAEAYAAEGARLILIAEEEQKAGLDAVRAAPLEQWLLCLAASRVPARAPSRRPAWPSRPAVQVAESCRGKGAGAADVITCDLSYTERVDQLCKDIMGKHTSGVDVGPPPAGCCLPWTAGDMRA